MPSDHWKASVRMTLTMYGNFASPFSRFFSCASPQDTITVPAPPSTYWQSHTRPRKASANRRALSHSGCASTTQKCTLYSAIRPASASHGSPEPRFLCTTSTCTVA
jgi:hypothetical protein